jgi:hypothetical protein
MRSTWLLNRVDVLKLVGISILLAVGFPTTAQWLNVPTKGIPRTKDGKPDLSAPAPQKPDGKPDLSGVWEGDRQNLKYLANLAADFKPDDFPIQPWAEALTKERMTGADESERPTANCLPYSIPVADANTNSPLKIIQEPDLVMILHEFLGLFRQIFLDGRTLSKDPNPTWMGYSVGRWDGDTLVVDTTGFNGKTWLDGNGHPATDVLHITERFRRRDFGHLDVQLTIDDPKAYTKPWSVDLAMHLLPDTDLLEYVCNENEKDVKHMVGK